MAGTTIIDGRMKDPAICSKTSCIFLGISKDMKAINKILCGDHVQLLEQYPDEFFDMFLTSPPYDKLRKYKGYVFNFKPLAHELWRTLKPGGVGVWIVGDQTQNGSETLSSFRQAIYFRENVGFNLHDTMIYHKNGAFVSDNSRYKPSFEYMFVLSKGTPKTITLRMQKCLPNTSQNSKGTRRHFDGTLRTHTLSHYKIRIKDNVWKISTGWMRTTTDKNAYAHPAMFPERLAEDHILSWSAPGDLILDPMCGAGTTCKMALKHSRRYVGIDISEEYCMLARNRIENFKLQLTIFDKVERKI